MVVFAVFDIIDKLGGEYEKAMAGDIKAKVNVLGKTSEYAFARNGSDRRDLYSAHLAASDHGVFDRGREAAGDTLPHGQCAALYG